MNVIPREPEVPSDVFDSLPAGVMLFEVVRDGSGALVDLQCRRANPEAARALAVPEASVGRRVHEWLAPEDASACLGAAKLVLATGRPVEVTLGAARVQWHGGGETLSLIVLDDGAPVRSPGPFASAETIALMNQAPFAASIVWGSEHRFALANRQYEQMVGRTGLVGKTMREVFPELQADAPVLKMLDDVRTTGRAITAHEYCVPLDLDGDGRVEEHYFRFTCSPVLHGSEVVAIHTAAFEVTSLIEDRRKAEDLARRLEQNIHELESIETALREQIRQKDELLAVLGHELRNPLAAIRSASEVLASSDAKLPRVRQVLDRQTSHMARLLDDLLDLTRVRSGRLEIEPVVLDLCEVVLEAVSRLGAGVREHRLTIDAPSRPLWVRGDRARLAQVIRELLDNALRYTPPRGEVKVCLVAKDEGATLTVTDTGVGIEPELLPRLFRPFQQAPQGLARSSGGLGLGLSMAKTIIELHRGTIEARSAGRDCGCEIEVWLPSVEAEAEVETETEPAFDGADASPVAGRARIMLIEDNEDAAELFAALLRARGHEVYIAGRGREGLAAMGHWCPDAVICDIGLPDIDGYAVARAIRSDPRLDDVQLLALSGYGQEEDRRRSVEAGFDVHFTKPTDIDEILARIHSSRVRAGPA